MIRFANYLHGLNSVAYLWPFYMLDWLVLSSFSICPIRALYQWCIPLYSWHTVGTKLIQHCSSCNIVAAVYILHCWEFMSCSMIPTCYTPFFFFLYWLHTMSSIKPRFSSCSLLIKLENVEFAFVVLLWALLRKTEDKLQV